MRRFTSVPLLVLLVAACGNDAPKDPGPSGSVTAKATQTAPQQALDRGIAWLRSQAREGKWSDARGPSTGFTAIALAPVVAALPADQRGADPLVRSAAAYLLAKQRDDGAIADAAFLGYENYLTSATLMALTILDDPAQKAERNRMRDYLTTLQRADEGRHAGGFGYNKRKGADLSNAQYTLEALRTAGIPPDHEVMRKAIAYLEKVQNRSENEANQNAVWHIEIDGEQVKVVPGNDGSAGYEPGVSKAGWDRLPDGTFVARGYGSMTYALLKCYILTGLEADDARVQAVLDWLGKHYTWDENPGFRKLVEQQPERKDAPFFGLYYYYMTAAKALRLAHVTTVTTPAGPRDWRKDLTIALLKRQREDGSWLNSQSPRWEEGHPVLATAFATIALQDILARK